MITEDVVAISDTVLLDRDWILATYAQNVIGKYKRISQTVVVGNSVYNAMCYVSMLFLLINFPLEAAKVSLTTLCATMST